MVAPLVYIAGPYTHPEPVSNCRKAIDAWEVLYQAGYTPLVPHISLLIEMVYPHTPDEWYGYDFELLRRCDWLLRLPGESPGADAEVEFAHEHRICVFEGTAQEFVRVRGAA